MIKKFRHRDNPSSCVLYLYAIENNLDLSCINITDNDVKYLYMHKYLYRNNEGVILVNPDGKDYNFLDKVQEYRSIFKGIRNGSTGSKQVVIKKLREWLLENDKNIEDVIEYAKLHVNMRGKLSRNADNFIFKTIDNDGSRTRISPLSDFIEELENNSSEDFTETI